MLLLIIGAGAVLATEDQQQRLDLEQEQLLTRLPWLLLHPPLLRGSGEHELCICSLPSDIL